MNIYLIIAYFGTLGCIALAIFVLLQDFKKPLNRLFFLMSLTLSGFILSSNLCNTAADRKQIELLYKISSFFFSSYFAVNLHFNAVLTKIRIKRLYYSVLYLPVPVIVILTFASHSLFTDFVFDRGQWIFVPAYGYFGFYFTLIYCILYSLTSLLLVENFRRKTGKNKEKRQAVIINSSYLLTTVLAAFAAYIIPAFGIYRFSLLGPDSYVIYLIAIYYVVFKFRFLNLTASIRTEEIIANISDILIILYTDFKIFMVNNKCTELLNHSSEKFKNISFFKIIADKEEMKNKFNDLLESKDNSINCRLTFRKEDENIMTDSYISKIYDKFNDLSGFLIISMENKDKTKFQNMYKISKREFEIIELIISGFQNDEISKKLGISIRTVETHRLHIYSKLGISNRIELFIIASEFNLISKNKPASDLLFKPSPDIY